MAFLRVFIASLLLAGTMVSGSLMAGAGIPGYPQEGHWPYGPTYTAETWTDGNDSLLFYGEGTVLRIADVSDPTNMNLLSEIRTGNPVWHIDILENGQLAAVSDRNKYVSIINIANPAAPVLLGQYQVDNGRLPYGVAFGPPGSNLLYVAIAPLGLYVLDITSPGAPARIGSFEDPGTDFVFDIEVLGNYAFLADDVEGVTAVNISNPNAPVFSAEFSAATQASHITLDGNTAYVSRRNQGTHIIDLNVAGNPVVMTELGVIDPLESPQEFGIFYRTEITSTGRAVISDGIQGNGLHVVNVDTPATPVYLDNFSSAMFYAAVLGTTAFASTPESFNIPQVRAIDVDVDGNVNAPEQVDQLLTFDISTDLNVDGNLIMVANESAGAVLIDASNIGNPVTRAWVSIGNNSAKSVTKVGNALVIATYDNNLQVVDITDLDNPILLAPFNLSGGATSYEVSTIPGTSRVLVAANFGGVKIVDFTDPNSPSIYSEWAPTSGNVTRAAIDNSIVAAGGNTTMWTVDFTNPVAPLEKNTTTMPQTIEDIDIKGNYVYVADGISGLRVMDRVTGGVLTLTDSFVPNLGTVTGVKVRGNTAYIASGTRFGMFLIDISNPADITQAGLFDTPGEATRVDINDSILVLSERYAGVRIWGTSVVPGGPIFEDGFESED